MNLPDAQHSTPARIPDAAGIGLRFPHHGRVLHEQPAVAWWEVHAENYLGGGPAARVLERVRRDRPVSLHAVGMSLGSAQGVDEAHLARLRALIDRIEPGLVSDHLSWSTVDGTYLPDLLPLPMTEESLALFARNLDHAQHRLGRRLLIENPSACVAYRHSTIPEAEFLAELVARTGCGLLLDVNNLFVSTSNLGGSPLAYLARLPADAVGEIHLAGHAQRVLADGSILRIDDHGSRVPAPVWELLALALQRLGPRPCLIEWDTDIPELEVLQQEAQRAQEHIDAVRTAVPRAGAPARVPGSAAAAADPNLYPAPGTQRIQSVVGQALRSALLEPAAGEFHGNPDPVIERLSVLQGTVEGALVKALRLNYPAVEKLVGAEFFEGAARIFLADHPASAPRLDEYGEGFDDFLQRFEPAATIAWIADVARLERAVSRALHADAPGVACRLEELAAAVDAHDGQVRLQADPSLSLVRLHSPADTLWRAVLEDDDAALADIDMSDARERDVLVLRRGDRVSLQVLAPARARWLARVLAGEDLSQAFASADPGENCVGWLSEHLRDGHFPGFRVSQRSFA